MTSDNVIQFTQRRAKADHEALSDRSAQRDAERYTEAAALLEKLRERARIPNADRPTLVRNLGRLVEGIEPAKPLEVAARILKLNVYQKRKRYLRFSNESSDPSPDYAAAGSEFAAILDGLIDEQVRRGANAIQARITSVFRALKGTSFRPRYRFQTASNDAEDAVEFSKAVERVMANHAEEADLGEYFELVSKYSLEPAGNRLEPDSSPSNRYLCLRADGEPNYLHRWERLLEDDDPPHYVPWWAPKCVIGHLYVPFQCTVLKLSDEGVAEAQDICGGEVTVQTWRNHDCSSYVDPFKEATRSESEHFWHRLPIWLVALPTQGRIVPCLYPSVHYRDPFQVETSLVDEKSYYTNENMITPCFVSSIGGGFDDDAVYSCGDYDDPPSYYVRITKNGIRVIGHEVDHHVRHFKAEAMQWTEDEFPPWLDPHPVQSLLPLTMESEVAMAFSLAPRLLPKTVRFHDWGAGEPETIFRAAHPDPLNVYTELRQNTLAAYLLRNFVGGDRSTIVEALKCDAVAKCAAARELVEGEVAKYHQTFDDRYPR